MDYRSFADILAIPMFLLMVIYFRNKKDRTIIENMLYLFGLCGLLVDSYFTYILL